MRYSALSLLFFILFTEIASGQTPGISGFGYFFHQPQMPAPGQVITLQVRGIRGPIPNGYVEATTVPLPTTLAGISVSIRQPNNFPNPVPVPIFSVSPTEIMVQIPYEVRPTGFGGPEPRGVASLVVSEGGVAGEPLSLFISSTAVHVVRSCDTRRLWEAALQSQLSCQLPLITNARGGVVSEVRSGEAIVIYAFGLGATTPPVRTGFAASQPTPLAAPLSVHFFLRFPTQTPLTVSAASPQPVFAGLVPGYVGLYQVNLIVPDLPADVLPCRMVGVPNPNLLIAFGTFLFDDIVPLCVQR